MRKIRKEVYFLVLILFLSKGVSMNAQVTIGSLDEPHEGAVLDLKSTTKGLLLPQVSLKDVTEFSLDGVETEAAGMIVFNTNVDLIGGVGKGVYAWDGEKWMQIVNNDNNNQTVDSKCGAYIAPGKWLKMMCYNLGADESGNPFTYSESILGDLYQWGRTTDGHEKRNSVRIDGKSTSTDWDINGQIATGSNKFGKFITTSSSPLDWRTSQSATLWGDGSQAEIVSKASGDPCPAGWQVPTQKQWKAIYDNNNWKWTEKGYMIGDALFLPVTGIRFFDNASIEALIEGVGYYWSSSVYTSNNERAQALHFHSAKPDPAFFLARGNGIAVRCIQSENY